MRGRLGVEEEAAEGLLQEVVGYIAAGGDGEEVAVDGGGVGVVEALKGQLAGGRWGGIVLKRVAHCCAGGISRAAHGDEPELAGDEEAGSRGSEKAESKTDASCAYDDKASAGIVDMAVEGEDGDAETEEDEACLDAEEDAGGGGCRFGVFDGDGLEEAAADSLAASEARASEESMR